MLGFIDDAVDFVGNGVKSAGRAIYSGVKAVSRATGKIGKALKKIPIVGPGLSAVYDTAIASQIDFATAVLSGKRIDRAAYNLLERHIDNTKDLAPYVQAVVANVPGVGTGIAGAIGASVALADGKPINEALLEGIKGALPGGPLAKAGFEIAEGVMTGQSLDDMALDAMPLPDNAKKGFRYGLRLTKALASGKKPEAALVETAFKALDDESKKRVGKALKKFPDMGRAAIVANVALANPKMPKDVRKAVKIGVALGNAKKIQRDERKEIKDAHKKIVSKGKETTDKNEVLKESRKLAKGSEEGFDAGIGLVTHSKISKNALKAVRENLTDDDKPGFDLAIATHTGMVTRKAYPKATPAARAGFYAASSLKAATPNHRVEIAKMLGQNPESRDGAMIAFKRTIQERDVWWVKLLNALGVDPKAG